jgi:hypothetical protein
MRNSGWLVLALGVGPALVMFVIVYALLKSMGAL